MNLFYMFLTFSMFYNIVESMEEAVTGRDLQALEENNRNYHLWDIRVGGKVEIPYVFTTNWRYTFTDAQKNLIVSELTFLQNQLEVVRFVPWAGQRDYLEIFRAGDCQSEVGRHGWRQVMFLGPGCMNRRGIQQTFLHALGIYKEHVRTDRDQHVQIHWDNINPYKEGEFHIRTNSKTYGTKYDLLSVMHPYPDFHIQNFNTFTITSKGGTLMGGSSVSKKDIQLVQLMYKCPSGPRHFNDFCTHDCQCKLNQGRCRDDSGCSGSLVCQPFSGTFYGQEKCVTIWERCSREKPCRIGYGDCDSDDECIGGGVYSYCKHTTGVDSCAAMPTPQPTPFPTDDPNLTIPPTGGNIFAKSIAVEEDITNSDVDTTDNKNPIYIYVGAGSGAFILLSAVGAILYKQRKKSQQLQLANNNAESPDPQDI